MVMRSHITAWLEHNHKPLDWISRIAWLGLIGGPLLLIAAAVFDFGTGRITTLAVVGFIGGFLTLVIRMKDRLPPDDTRDDGAVV